jgi:hypothetical protein
MQELAAVARRRVGAGQWPRRAEQREAGAGGPRELERGGGVRACNNRRAAGADGVRVSARELWQGAGAQVVGERQWSGTERAGGPRRGATAVAGAGRERTLELEWSGRSRAGAGGCGVWVERSGSGGEGQ